MAGLVPAIHVLNCGAKDVDARHRAGHDDCKVCMRQRMTIALPAHAERRFGLDLSKPVLYAFALVLLVLIVLPISWLLLYSLTDASGSITLGNFYRLFTESSFIDPLITTFILATSSAVICCAVAAPM